MASLVLSGDTSGSITVSAPAVAGSTTQTLVNVTGTLAPIVSGTVNAGGTNPFPSSSGPATVDFTGIPSWVKRITIMFSGVSTNGTSNLQIQIGSGSVTTSGYASAVLYNSNGSLPIVSSATTTGFLITPANAAAEVVSGTATLFLINSNTWVCSGTICDTANTVNVNTFSGTSANLSGALDRVRITTVNGTDLFDAGSINILYE